MPRYTVRSGDCLSKIAIRHGFNDYRVIYDHPENAGLKQKRPNPNVICPGDKVFIPDRQPLKVTLQTGKAHSIVVQRPQAKLLLYVKDVDGEPLANESFVLHIAGVDAPVSGCTDGTGRVEANIPALTADAVLTFPAVGIELNVRVGHLDALTTPAGVLARLENLGFVSASQKAEANTETLIREALVRFQQAHELEPSGELDTLTTSLLRDAHDQGVVT